MLKHFAITAAIIAVLTMVALSYITARYIDTKEILRAQTELADLRVSKEQLETKVKSLTAQQIELNKTINSQELEIKNNKATIARLETEREGQQLTVRKLRTKDDMLKALAKTYPALAKAKNFGLTDIKDDINNITLSSLCIPTGFTETFMIEHNNMLSYKKQIDEYQANEKQYGSILALKDKVYQLESEKTTAYQQGYETAFARYEALNNDYIELLKKPPKIEFKAPSWWSVLGGVAVGFAIGAK